MYDKHLLLLNRHYDALVEKGIGSRGYVISRDFHNNPHSVAIFEAGSHQGKFFSIRFFDKDRTLHDALLNSGLKAIPYISLKNPRINEGEFNEFQKKIDEFQEKEGITMRGIMPYELVIVGGKSVISYIGRQRNAFDIGRMVDEGKLNPKIAGEIKKRERWFFDRLSLVEKVK